MDWFLILVVAGGAVAVARIVTKVRALRKHSDGNDDWDFRMIERLRAQGSDPFQPHDVDFFFALPTEESAQTIRARLEAEGFSVEVRQGSGVEHPYSVYASKSLRLTLTEMRELSQRFTRLAQEQGGRYDGWTAPIVPRGA